MCNWSIFLRKNKHFANNMNIFRRSFWIHSYICFFLGETKPKQKSSNGDLLCFISALFIFRTLSPGNATCSLKFSHPLQWKTKFIRPVSRLCNYSLPFVISSSQMGRGEAYWHGVENGLKNWSETGGNSQNSKVFLKSRLYKLT